MTSGFDSIHRRKQALEQKGPIGSDKTPVKKQPSTWTKSAEPKPDTKGSTGSTKLAKEFNDGVFSLAQNYISLFQVSPDLKPGSNGEERKAIQGELASVAEENQTIAVMAKMTLDSVHKKFQHVDLQKAKRLALKGGQEALEDAAKNFQGKSRSLKDGVHAAEHNHQFIKNLDPNKLARERGKLFAQAKTVTLNNYQKTASERATNLQNFGEEVKKLKKLILDQDKMNTADQDNKVLTNLIEKLEKLEKSLKEAQEKAEQASNALSEIQKVIAQSGVTPEMIKRALDANRDVLVKAKEAEQPIMTDNKHALKALEQHLEEVLYSSQSIEEIRKIRQSLQSEDEERERTRKNGFLLLDLADGRLGLPDTKEKGGTVWTALTKIRKISRIDENTTEFSYRRDNPKIRVWTQSREAGRVLTEEIYSKNLLRKGIDNEKYNLTLEILGDSTNADDKRAEGILTFIHKQRKVEEEKRVREANAQEADTDKHIKPDENVWRQQIKIDMERLVELNLTMNLVNEKHTPADIEFDFTEGTLPKTIVKHDEVMSNYLPPDKIAKCVKINLETRQIIGGGGRIIDIDDLDLTSSKWSPTEGLTLRRAWLLDACNIRLNVALSKEGLGPATTDLENRVKKVTSDYVEHILQNVETMISQKRDKREIEEAFYQAEQATWFAKCVIDEMRETFYSIPRDKLDADEFHRKKGQILTNKVEYLEEFLTEATKIQNLGKNHYRKLGDIILDIRLSKGLFGHQKLDKQKNDTWKQWLDAEHLDEVFPAGLLTTPLMAETFITKIVKEAGKASYRIEHLKTQSDTLAEKAQSKAKEDTLNEFVQAFTTYKKSSEESDKADDQDKSLDALHTTLRSVINRTELLKATADAAEKRREFAQLIGDIPDDTDRAQQRKSFLSKAVETRAKKECLKIINDILDTVEKAAEAHMRDATIRTIQTGGPEIARKQMELAKDIRSAVKTAIDASTNQDVTERNAYIIDQAYKKGIELLTDMVQKDITDQQPEQDATVVVGNLIKAAKTIKTVPRDGSYIQEYLRGKQDSLQKSIEQLKKDAEKEWDDNNKYGNYLVSKMFEKELKPYQSMHNVDVETVQTVYHLATIERKKLETAQARLDAAKTKDVKARTAAYKDAMDVQYSAESVRKPDFPGSAPRRAHLWIHPTSGQLMDHNDALISTHLFQDVRGVGDSHNVDNRGTHAGITFANTGHNQDVSYTDLATNDDKWTARTRIYLHEPDGQGGYRDMLHFANGMKIPLADIDLTATTQNATDGVTIATTDGRKFNLQKMDRRAHLEIDPQTGQITMGRNPASATTVRFYLQDVARFGNAYTNSRGNRNTHTGIGFKNAPLTDPAGGTLANWDVGHDYHLSTSDDGWKTKTYIHFLPDETGGYVDMLHLADGTWLNVSHIDLAKTEYSSKDGVTIVLRDGDDVPADLRDRKLNLKRIDEAVRENLTEAQANEAAALLATQEAAKKGVWIQAEENVLQAARTLADLQQLSKTAPRTGGLSPYETAIKKARDGLLTFANTEKDKVRNNLKRSDTDTADGTRGQIDEKNAVWLEAVQRYAQGQKKIADATKKAADARVQQLGGDADQARHSGAQLVKGLVDLAQRSANAVGGDSLEAGVITAEKAALTQVALAKHQKEATDSAQRVAVLMDTDPKEAIKRVSHGFESNIAAVGTITIEMSRTKARDAAQECSRLTGTFNAATPNTQADAADQLLTDRIAQIDDDPTFNAIKDEYVRNTIKNATKAMVAEQWALSYTEKLEVARTARLLEQEKGVSNETQLQTAATDAMQEVTDDIDHAKQQYMDGGAIKPVQAIEAGSAAAVAAKKRAEVWKAKLKVGRAEKTSARELRGANDAAQLTAFNAGVQAVDNKLKIENHEITQSSIVEIVRYGESQAQIAHALVETADHAQKKARERGLHLNVPAGPNAPTQMTERKAAAQYVKDQADLALNPGNPVKQDVDAAKYAKEASASRRGVLTPEKEALDAQQAVINAYNRAQAIPDLAGSSQQIQNWQDTQVAATQRWASQEGEIADLATEGAKSAEALVKPADKPRARQEGAQEVFNAANEAAILFQAQAKVTRSIEDLERMMARNLNNPAQIINNVNTALTRLDIRFKQDGLGAALAYAEYLAQVAKYAKIAADAAREAAPNGQENAHAQAAAIAVNNRAVNVYDQHGGQPMTQNVEAGAAATHLAESYVQIHGAVQRLIDKATGNNRAEKRLDAQNNIGALHRRVDHARAAPGANTLLDPAKSALRTACNLIAGSVQHNGTDNDLDRDTTESNALFTDAQVAIRERGLAVGRAITETTTKPYTLREYYGDRDEEYQCAKKAATKAFVLQSITRAQDEASVEEGGSLASDTVKEAGSEARQKFLDQIQTKRIEAWETTLNPNAHAGTPSMIEKASQRIEAWKTTLNPNARAGTDGQDPRMIEKTSQEILDALQSDFEKRVDTAAKRIAAHTSKTLLERSTNLSRDTYRKILQTTIKKYQDSFKRIEHDAGRISRIRGGGEIDHHAAIAEAGASYATYLTALARSVETTYTDAKAHATLTGMTTTQASSYATNASRDCILRAEMAQHQAALNGQDPIDQFAASADAVTRFAASHAEARRFAEAAERSARERAALEKLPPKLPANPGPNDRSQETEGRRAARNVMDTFEQSRRQAADAKIQQGHADLALFAREIEALSVGARTATALQQEVTNLLPQVRRELRHGGSAVGIEEGIAQFVSDRVAILRAERDLALSTKGILKARNILTGVAHTNEVQAEIEGIETTVNQEIINKRNDGKNLLAQNMSAAEVATYKSMQQKYIENAVIYEGVISAKKGIPNVAPIAGADTRYTRSTTISNEITNLIEDTITNEQNAGTDSITARKIGAEIGAQFASTQYSRIAGALAARKAGQSAGSPETPALLVPGVSLQDDTERGEQSVNRALNHGIVGSLLPAQIPQNQRDILKVPITSRFALRSATAEAKITQVVQATSQTAQMITDRATDPTDPNRANLLDTAGQEVAIDILEIVNEARTTADQAVEQHRLAGAEGRDSSIEALTAALRESRAYTKIAEYIDGIEADVEHIITTANPGANALAIAQAKREAIAQLLPAAQHVRTTPALGIAGLTDPTVAFVLGAKRLAISYHQYREAVERVQPSAANNAQDLVDHINNSITTTNPADVALHIATEAAGGAQNLIDTRLPDAVNDPATNNKNTAIAAAQRDLQNSVQDSLNDVLETLDGAAAAKRNSEFIRTFEDSEEIAKYVDVAQAMNDASKSAAAIEELLDEDEDAQTTAALGAADHVRRAAIHALHTAKAAKLDEKAQKAAIISATSLATSRFIAKHTTAVSMKEEIIAKTGDDPFITAHAQRIDAQNEIRQSLADLDTIIRDGAARKAGLQIEVNGVLSVNRTIAENTPLKEARAAIQQWRKATGKSGDEQTKAADNLEKVIVEKANKVKQTVLAAGGDEVEATIAAVTVVERLATIERAKSDAALAAWETAKMTGENPETEAEQAIKTVERRVETAQNRAEEQGLDQAAQIAAGAAKARQFAKFEKNISDGVKPSQAATAKAEHESIVKDIRTAMEKIDKNSARFAFESLVKSSRDTLDKLLESAYTPEEIGDPATSDAKGIRAIPGIITQVANNPTQAQITLFNKENEERKKIMKQVQENILKTASEALKTDKIPEGAATIMSYLTTQKSIIELQRIRLATVARPAVATATPAQIDTYNRQLIDIRTTAEKDINNVVQQTRQQAQIARKDAREEQADIAAALARYVSEQAGGNAPTQSNAADKAKQDITSAIHTIQQTTTDAYHAFSTSFSASIVARIHEVERAMRGLTPDDAKKVKAASEQALKDAVTNNKSFIEQQAEAAAAAAHEAYKLRATAEGTKIQAEGQAAAENKAEQAVYAAAAATHLDITKASQGTTIQTAISNDVVRWAIARANMAQAVKVIGANIRLRVERVVTALPAPANPPYRLFANIPPNPANETLPNYQTRVTDELTQRITKNVLNLATAKRDAERRDPNTGNLNPSKDPVAAWEKGTTAVTTYATQFTHKNTLEQNQTASTAAKSLADLTKHYSLKAAERDATREDATATDVAHVLTFSETASIDITADMAAISAINISYDTNDGDRKRQRNREEAQREAREAAAIEKEASKAEGKTTHEQFETTRQSATQASATRIEVAREIRKVTDSVHAGVIAAGFDTDQITPEVASEIRKVALAKQQKVLESALKDAIEKANTLVEGTITMARGYPHLPNHFNLDGLRDAALRRIETAGAEARTNARDKDPITQHREAVAAVRAQSEIESARIQILARMQQAWTLAGIVDNPANRWRDLNTLQNEAERTLDHIVQDAKANAGPDAIQQYIAAAAAAQHMASLRNQFAQTINTPPATQGNLRRQIHDNAFTAGEDVLPRFLPTGAHEHRVQREIAILDYAKREVNPTATEAQKQTAARDGLRQAELAGLQAAIHVKDSIKGLKEEANEAYLDGAQQQTELGQTFGEALQTLAKHAKTVEYALRMPAGSYGKYFAKWLQAIDNQADEEAQANGLNLDQRIQARTKILIQTRDVMVKLATSMEETANAARASKLAAGGGEGTAHAFAQKKAQKMSIVFNKKKAEIKAAGGDLSRQLSESIKEVEHSAKAKMVIYQALQDVAKKAKEDLSTFITDEQEINGKVAKIVDDTSKEVKQRLADAKAQGKGIGSKEHAAIIRQIGMEILLRRRTDTTTEDFESTFNAVAKEIKREAAAPPPDDSNAWSQVLTEYRELLDNPKPNPVERTRLEEIKEYFENTYGVHPYRYNRYCLANALEAARKGRFCTGDSSAGYYIDRMKPPEPNGNSAPEDSRQAIERGYVLFLQAEVRRLRNSEESDERLGYALSTVDRAMKTNEANFACAEEAFLDLKTAPEALGKMNLGEDRPLQLPKEDVTDPQVDKRRQQEKILSWNDSLEDVQKRSPKEILEMQNAVHEYVLEGARMSYELLRQNCLSNPVLYRALEEKGHEIIDKLYKQYMDNYIRELAKKYEIDKLKYNEELAREFFWKGFFKDWGLLTLRNTIDFGTKAEKGFFDAVMKILAAPVK